MKKTILVAISLVFLSGCADKVNLEPDSISDSIGFLYGLWHGIILPWSFLTSLFDDTTAIYSSYNNGGMYDFGFFIGTGSVGRLIGSVIMIVFSTFRNISKADN